MYLLPTSTALKSLNKTADHDHICLTQTSIFAESKNLLSRENVRVRKLLSHLMKENFVN